MVLMQFSRSLGVKTLTFTVHWDMVTDSVEITNIEVVKAKQRADMEWYWFNWEHATMRKIS